MRKNPFRAVRATHGLEYNRIFDQWRFSYGVYYVDLARSPYAMSADFDSVNVNDKITRVNRSRHNLDKLAYLAKGKR